MESVIPATLLSAGLLNMPSYSNETGIFQMAITPLALEEQFILTHHGDDTFYHFIQSIISSTKVFE